MSTTHREDAGPFHSLMLSKVLPSRRTYIPCVRLEIGSPAKLMAITCIIRYQIDPFQKDAFRQYAESWGRIIPRCGGDLIGYFLPYEGTNDIAWGLIAFASLADYENYRARLRSDPDALENFRLAQSRRLILREERNFVEVVDGTLRRPPDAPSHF